MEGIVPAGLLFEEEIEGAVEFAENGGGGLRWTDVGAEIVGGVAVALRYD
jgi:hypothetical protein